MNSALLLLPFLSFFTLVLGIATGKAYASSPLVSWIFYGLTVALVLAWLIKERRDFSSFFRKKGARHGLSQGLSVVLSILVAVGIGMLSKRDRFNKSFDLTKDKVNTLSSDSVKLVGEIQEKKANIQAIAFFQSEEKKAEFRRAINLYKNAGASIEVEYIDPQTDPTRALAENISSSDTVILKFSKQEARLTSFSEEKISNALIRLMKEKEKIVYFLTGHGEADLSSQESFGYAAAKAELESERLVVKTVNILEELKVPSDANLLVLAGPKYDLKDEELGPLRDYLLQGGALMVLVDAMSNVPRLNGLISEAGISLNDDFLIIRPDDPRAKLLGQNNAIVTDFDSASPVTADFVKRGGVALMTPNTRSLEIKNDNKLGLRVTSLAKSSEIVARISGVKSESDLKGGIAKDRISSGKLDVFAIAAGPVKSPKLAAAEGKPKEKDTDVKPDQSIQTAKELRVFVGGSSHLASNVGAQRAENLDLFINAINYLVQDDDFVAIRPKDSTKSQLNLTSAGSQFALLGMTWIYPLLFLGFGTFYWMRRRQA